MEMVTDDPVADSRIRQAWEDAYRRFQSPSSEVQKFRRRLIWFGVDRWSRDLEVVELFSGRGNGLVAWERLGFGRLEGVDWSSALVNEYQGIAKCHKADCRSLPLADGSRDVVVVHGGLHHLPRVPADLEQVLKEVHRVLKPNGAFLVVEPWMTPFLAVVHALCRSNLARNVSVTINALAAMIELERTTYDQWLKQPELILNLLDRHFTPVKSQVRLGKLLYFGRKQFHL